MYSKGTMQALGHLLESGNHAPKVSSPVGCLLPEQNALRYRLDAFLDGCEFTRSSQYPRYRKEIDEIFQHLYEDDTVSLPGRSGIVPLSIIIADGSRPVYFVEDDHLTKKGKANGPFVDVIEQHATDLERVALSVGRIETDEKSPSPGMDKWYDGTAFLVAGDIAMTNRHVLERMVNEPNSNVGPFTLKANYWLNFDATLNSSQSRRFRIDDVIYAGPEVIGSGGDITRLDLALLKIGNPEIAGTPMPAPLVVNTVPLLKTQKIAVIGYPAAPSIYVGTGTPPVDYELEEVLRDLFDARFGYKRCASGEVDAVAGSFPEDTARWTIKHDASTLSGNSGSPIFTFSDEPLSVSALHFSGTPRVANLGHVFDQITADLKSKGIPIT